MDWTEETIVRLRGFWDEGHSTAEIGRRLGVTKNAVVGKAHRLELPARPSPIRRDGLGAQSRRPASRRMAGPTLPPLGSNSRISVPAALAAAASMSPSGTGGLAGAMPPQLEAVQAQAQRPELPRPVQSQAEPKHADIARSQSHIVAVPPPRLPQVSTSLGSARPYARSLTCCWPIGEPGTKSFRFCDDGASQGKPYCAQHAAIAYVKIRDRREDAA